MEVLLFLSPRWSLCDRWRLKNGLELEVLLFLSPRWSLFDRWRLKNGWVGCEVAGARCLEGRRRSGILH